MMQSMPARLNLIITNEIDDIFNLNKICVRIDFDKSIHAVISSSIFFSIDVPGIAVEKFDCIQRPSIQFLPTFKHNKKVFLEPFNCEIKIKNRSNAILKNANLYAYCIIIDKDGRTSSVTVFKPLFNAINFNFLSKDINTTLTNTLLQNNLKIMKIYPKFDTKKENIILDKLSDLFGLVSNKAHNFMRDFKLMWIYFFIILFLLCIILLQKFIQIPNILKDLRLFLLFCWCILTVIIIKNVFALHIFYVILAALFTVISLYYIFSAKSDSIVDKLKSLIGFVFAISIIPLLLKAFLLFKNL